MKNVLLLASSSSSRKQLLTDAAIPFTVVQQTADEHACCDWGLPLPQVVERIALAKMAHVIMPVGTQGQIAFVLTADTLTQFASGALVGKPVDRADAINQIRAARKGLITTGTAFCLEKKICAVDSAGQKRWVTDIQVIRYVAAQYRFEVTDDWIDRYFAISQGLSGSGSIAIEGAGSLFLKEIHGSYSTVVGLPLYELRQELENIGFFEQEGHTLST